MLDEAWGEKPLDQQAQGAGPREQECLGNTRSVKLWDEIPGLGGSPWDFPKEVEPF
jgi:hypothetical protein